MTFTTPELINSIGLGLDILGAALIFFNSPKPSHSTVIYQNDELERLARKDNRKHNLAKAGLFILIMGFILQLISNFN